MSPYRSIARNSVPYYIKIFYTIYYYNFSVFLVLILVWKISPTPALSTIKEAISVNPIAPFIVHLFWVLEFNVHFIKRVVVLQNKTQVSV